MKNKEKSVPILKESISQDQYIQELEFENGQLRGMLAYVTKQLNEARQQMHSNIIDIPYEESKTRSSPGPYGHQIAGAVISFKPVPEF
jgi:hypothetical protein